MRMSSLPLLPLNVIVAKVNGMVAVVRNDHVVAVLAVDNYGCLVGKFNRFGIVDRYLTGNGARRIGRTDDAAVGTNRVRNCV